MIDARHHDRVQGRALGALVVAAALSVGPMASAQETGSVAAEPEGSVERVTRHLVKRGETLSGILLKQYGFTRQEYRLALPDVLRLNRRGVRSANHILWGFTILLPVPDRLAGEMGRVAIVLPHRREAALPRRSRTERAGVPAIPGPEVAPAHESPRVAALPRADGLETPVARPAIELEQHGDVNLQEAVEEIFPRMGIPLTATGETTFDLAPYGRVSIDNTKYPVIELPDGHNVILDFDQSFPDSVRALVESTWPNFHVVDARPERGLKGLIEQIFSRSRSFAVTRHQTVVFGTGAKLLLAGEWKIESTRESVLQGKITLLNVVEGNILPTPAYLREYARGHGVELVDVKRLRRGDPSPAVAPAPAPPEGVLPVITVQYQQPQDLTATLLTLVGQPFEREKRIALEAGPDTGVTVHLVADHYFTRDGVRYIVDHAHLPPELARYARDFRLQIIRIDAGDGFKEIVGKVYGPLKVAHAYAPYRMLEDAGRPAAYYNVEIPGFLVTPAPVILRRVPGDPRATYLPQVAQAFLLTDATVPPALEKILTERGYALERVAR